MSDNTKIEWTDATWNPITGCSVVSPGCTNCYAMRLAGTRLAHHPSRAGLTDDSKAGPVWNGKVRFNEQWRTQPLSWKQPRKIFVCAHGDLFHENVPDVWIDKVFAVMARAPQHTFQVLTKRSARMKAYIDGLTHQEWWKARLYDDDNRPHLWPIWPLANLWLGVTCEDQARADERIPDLLATPAAVRFVSAEPLLGPLNMNRAFFVGPEGGWEWAYTKRQMIDWVIVGGESGPGARPMHPDWARAIRDLCKRAGVAFHFKQWGEHLPYDEDNAGLYWPANDGRRNADRCVEGHDVHNVPDRKWIVGPPGTPIFDRVGKARAGRLLDGVEHNGMPEQRT